MHPGYKHLHLIDYVIARQSNQYGMCAQPRLAMRDRVTGSIIALSVPLYGWVRRWRTKPPILPPILDLDDPPSLNEVRLDDPPVILNMFLVMVTIRELAPEDDVSVSYRLYDSIFNLWRLQSRTKVSRELVSDLQYANDAGLWGTMRLDYSGSST